MAGISFSHRIKNTKAIDRIDVDHRKSAFSFFKERLVLAFFVALVTVGSAIAVLYIGVPKRLAFPYQVVEGQSEVVVARFISEDRVNLESRDSDFEALVTFHEFIDGVTGAPLLVDPEEERIIFLLLAIQASLSMLVVGRIVFEYLRSKRLVKILTNRT